MNLSEIWGAKDPEPVIEYDAYAGCEMMPFEVQWRGKTYMNSPPHWKSLIIEIEKWVLNHTDPDNPDDMFGLCDAWDCTVLDIESVMDGHAEMVMPTSLHSMGVGARAFNRCEEAAALLEYEMSFVKEMSELGQDIFLKSVFGKACGPVLSVLKHKTWADIRVDYDLVASVWTTLLTRKRARDGGHLHEHE